MGKPFWEQPLWRWDAMFAAGVRAHYHSSRLAARPMVANRCGLIVNISFWAAQKHIGNVAYGVSKAATDKLTADMASELHPHGVAVVSFTRHGQDGEGPGRGAMARSQQFRIPRIHWTSHCGACGRSYIFRRTGNVLVAATLAAEYGFTDVDGKTPRALTLADV